MPISKPKTQLILKLMELKDKNKFDIIYYKTS